MEQFARGRSKLQLLIYRQWRWLNSVWILAAIDLCLPKCKWNVVVGSLAGYTGNTRRLADMLASDSRITRLTIVLPKLGDVDTVRLTQLGQSSKVELVVRGSKAAFRGLVRSGTVFLSHDVHRDVGFRIKHQSNRKIINCWHEIAIKRHWLLDDSRRALFRKRRRAARLFDLVIASSDADAVAKSGFFGRPLPYILITGTPRNDWFYIPTAQWPSDLEELDARIEELLQGRRLCLYAPTWGRDLTQNPLISEPSPEVMSLLERHNAVLGYRLHLDDGDRLSTQYSFPYLDVCRAVIPEAQLLLNRAAVVISDYSSIWIDFLLKQRPVIAYLYDQEFYDREKGIIWDYDAVFPGPVVKDLSALCVALDRMLGEGLLPEEKTRYATATTFFHRHKDGKSGERVCEQIFGY